MLTVSFPDEIADYGGIDGVMLSDDYDEELLRMLLVSPGQILYLVIFMCLL